MDSGNPALPDSPALRSFMGLDAGASAGLAAEIAPIIGKFRRMGFRAGEEIIREGDPADALYLMDEGEVEAIKASEGDKLLARLSGGDIFGELALFTGKPRAATIRAKSEVSVFKLAKDDFEQLSRDHPKISGAFLNKLYARLGHAYRELEASEDGLRKANRMRTELASVFTNVVLVMAIYTFVLGTVFSGKIAFFESIGKYEFIVSRLVEAMALFVIIKMVLNSGQPLRSFGLTTEGWRKSLLESLIVSALVMGMLLFLKWGAMSLFPGFLWEAPAPGVEAPLLSAKYLDWGYASYIFVAPLQEFITRGAMQSSLQRLLVGKRSAFWAIMVTSFLFGSMHLYASIGLSAMAIVTGWLWGWMFARQGNLLGVSLSHFLIGNFAGLLGFWAIF